MHDSGKLDDNSGSADSQASGRIVANVANELKMPLAAMTEGHKHIMAILKDARASLSKIPGVGDKLLADLEEAQCTLESTANLSHFMKMSINRCIDYSHIKESHKLSPNLVSVNLLDALRLPADCVASIDPQHRLLVQPLPPTLCTHIIADVQWLQENLLCLLSNAVKYSSCDNVNTENPDNNATTSHTTLSLSLRTSASLQKEFSVTAVSPTKVSPTLHSSPLFMEDRMMLLVECEDSGIGLSDEALPQLFSPAKMAARLAAGTGLGLLSLAKRMEALNGHCGVRARRDGLPGCLFWFAFPYIPDELTADLVAHRPNINNNSKNITSGVTKNSTTSTSHHGQLQTENNADDINADATAGSAPAAESAEEEAELPSQDVLSSTLQNVLPSPMLFVPDESNDKFNSYAPFPVYAKRLSSRSLRSAMSNLPTTTSFGPASASEVHTPIGKWESDSSPSIDAIAASSSEVQALTPHSSGGQGGASYAALNGPLTSSTENLFSRSNSASNPITTTTSNAPSMPSAGTSRSTKGRSLILSLPTENSSRRGFPSLELGGGGSGSGGVVTSGVYGAGVGSVYGVSSVSNVTNSVGGGGGGGSSVNDGCGLPLPPRTTTTAATTTTNNTTSTTDANISTSNDATTATSEPPSTLVHAGTPPLPLPLPLPRVPFTPPRATSGLTTLSRTVEPSPASSTGTPQRASVDNGWTPDIISMIRTYVYTVLLVEDTPMILKMTSNLLRSQGFDVTTAKNGAEALALIKTQRFDVVLMDLQMPVLDGLEAARRIRAYEEATNVTEPLFLIAVSANSNPMIVVETLGAGYNNYIEKPFTVVQFQDVLAKYLVKKYYST